MAIRIRILGWVLLFFSGVFVLGGYGTVLVVDGFAALLEVSGISPFDITKWIFLVTMMAPGAALVALAGWLDKRQEE